jgi:hypothetical protein
VEEIGRKVSMEGGELGVRFKDALGDRRDHPLHIAGTAKVMTDEG